MKPACLAFVAAMIVMVCPVAASAGTQDSSQQEQNKRIVAEFYDKALNQKDFDAASAYFGPHYIQHNPTARDGIEGFKAFIQYLREKFPNSHSEIKHAYADGDYVILHVHAVREPGTRGLAIVDIFRLVNSKIVEHWDVRQDVPETAANSNGMF
jgi:predicted SnoaL-like aldol condensation-catalyzing enzyme